MSIVFALFPGVTQLDFTGPHQVLSRLPGAEWLFLASRAGEPSRPTASSLPGCAGSPTSSAATSSACPAGSAPPTMRSPTRSSCASCAGWPRRALRHLGLHRLAGARRRGAAARQAGRVPLGVARPAEPFGAIPDPARVVRDGNVVTGGGVTAGIDFALTLVAEIAGPEVAQAIQSLRIRPGAAVQCRPAGNRAARDTRPRQERNPLRRRRAARWSRRPPPASVSKPKRHPWTLRAPPRAAERTSSGQEN